MFEGLIGSVIGGIGSLLGGSMASQSAAENNRIQLQIAQQNMEMQREFAQNGIRWKAYDAQMAGLHPAFAMGASTNSFSPVGVNLQSDPMGSFVGQAGQHLGRAAEAVKSGLERKDDLMAKTAQALQLNRMGLENELLRSQIARTNQQIGPGIPAYGQTSPGGGSTGDVITRPGLGTYEMKPNEVTTTLPANQHTVAGPAGAQNEWRLGPNGALQPFPPKDLKVEDEFGAPLMARWLASQSYYRPPEAVWRQVWPGAIDVTWSTPAIGWVPVYGGRRGGEMLGGRAGRPLIPSSWHHAPPMPGSYRGGGFIGGQR